MKSPKEIKAWAIVDKEGKITGGRVFLKKSNANVAKYEDERVVPVKIVIEEI